LERYKMTNICQILLESKQVKYCIVISTNLHIVFEKLKNCLSSQRNPLLYVFIKGNSKIYCSNFFSNITFVNLTQNFIQCE
jgi:hypothetical protein